MTFKEIVDKYYRGKSVRWWIKTLVISVGLAYPLELSGLLQVLKNVIKRKHMIIAMIRLAEIGRRAHEAGEQLRQALMMLAEAGEAVG